MAAVPSTMAKSLGLPSCPTSMAAGRLDGYPIGSFGSGSLIRTLSCIPPPFPSTFRLSSPNGTCMTPGEKNSMMRWATCCASSCPPSNSTSMAMRVVGFPFLVDVCLLFLIFPSLARRLASLSALRSMASLPPPSSSATGAFPVSSVASSSSSSSCVGDRVAVARTAFSGFLPPIEAAAFHASVAAAAATPPISSASLHPRRFFLRVESFHALAPRADCR
mmetsp:Transcript_10911/g.67401  ORF Transcript_10911/g.67401 Transcript_10911/m.67401 type:complete len:220 (+) Transcript_10911:2489-3148(+)